jgi:hypothetical protein
MVDSPILYQNHRMTKLSEIPEAIENTVRIAELTLR